MRDWVIIFAVSLVLWGLWIFMNFVIDLFQEANRIRKEDRE